MELTNVMVDEARLRDEPMSDWLLEAICEAAIAHLAAKERSPDAYAVRMGDGAWVGIWNDKEIAESVCSKQPPSHKDTVVPVTITINVAGHGMDVEETRNSAHSQRPPAPAAPVAESAEPVAWMQIGLGHDEGTMFPRVVRPKIYNKDWWRFEPLVYASKVKETERIGIRKGLEMARNTLDGRAFVTHTHDDFGKGIERGLLLGVQDIDALLDAQKEKP